MANDFDIYKICTRCNGTGEVTINNGPYDPGPSEKITCPKCNGDGKIIWGETQKREE